MKLLAKKLLPEAKLPSRAHPHDAGLDLFAAANKDYQPGETFLVSTGIAIAVPEGYVGMICDRSSVAKRKLRIGGGIIDAGYRGEVLVMLHNLEHTILGHGHIAAGEKVAQLLLIPVLLATTIECEALDATERGAGGFGSTGK